MNRFTIDAYQYENSGRVWAVATDTNPPTMICPSPEEIIIPEIPP